MPPTARKFEWRPPFSTFTTGLMSAAVMTSGSTYASTILLSCVQVYERDSASTQYNAGDEIRPRLCLISIRAATVTHTPSYGGLIRYLNSFFNFDLNKKKLVDLLFSLCWLVCSSKQSIWNEFSRRFEGFEAAGCNFTWGSWWFHWAIDKL